MNSFESYQFELIGYKKIDWQNKPKFQEEQDTRGHQILMGII